MADLLRDQFRERILQTVFSGRLVARAFGVIRTGKAAAVEENISKAFIALKICKPSSMVPEGLLYSILNVLNVVPGLESPGGCIIHI